jgi:adsorption protein A
MTAGHRYTLLLGSLLLSLSSATAVQAEPLSEFEQFRSYPYMDRSYREAKKGNWGEVEKLMRHLLSKVPNNDEARALLVQSLARQRRYKEAVQALPDNSANSDALLNLRLTWIEQDPPGSDQVEQWIATSNLNQRIRLWQAYSLSLAKFGGAARAHDWLAHLAPKGDERILHLARANWSEQLHDWNGTIEQLAPLAAKNQLDAQGWERLANAYVQRLDEQPLQQLLLTAPSPQAARKARLAMIDRAIAMGHTQQAQRWMQSLPPADLADPTQRQRLWELARQTGDSATVQRLSAELQRPCLETADWLSRRDPQAALTQLKGWSSPSACKPPTCCKRPVCQSLGTRDVANSCSTSGRVKAAATKSWPTSPASRRPPTWSSVALNCSRHRITIPKRRNSGSGITSRPATSTRLIRRPTWR